VVNADLDVAENAGGWGDDEEIDIDIV